MQQGGTGHVFTHMAVWGTYSHSHGCICDPPTSCLPGHLAEVDKGLQGHWLRGTGRGEPAERRHPPARGKAAYLTWPVAPPPTK